MRSFTKGLLILGTLLFSGCGENKSLKIIPNEIKQADSCKDSNKQIELDCYDLISYKNSIALLRLGIHDYTKKDYEEAFRKFSFSKTKGNFYANALLSNLYQTGRGVKKDDKKSLELLEEVSEFEPIAAYNLSFYYINQKEYDTAIELLEFSAKNDVKKAQEKLFQIYSDNIIIKSDNIKSTYWKDRYKDNSINKLHEVYGLNRNLY